MGGVGGGVKGEPEADADCREGDADDDDDDECEEVSSTRIEDGNLEESALVEEGDW